MGISMLFCSFSKSLVKGSFSGSGSGSDSDSVSGIPAMPLHDFIPKTKPTCFGNYKAYVTLE